MRSTAGEAGASAARPVQIRPMLWRARNRPRPPMEQGEAGVRSATLRVATYNVHACVGTDGRFDPERVAAVLAELGADIIGLQEVESRASRTATDQFAYLRRATSMAAVEQPLLFEHGGGRYGNLLLARWPPRAVRQLDLGEPGREPRGAIEAHLRAADGRELRVVTTHLGLSAAERSQQIARLVEAIDEGAGGGDTVLIGDVNEWWPFSRSLRTIERRFGESPRPPTFPSWLPVFALDRIWSSPDLPIVRLVAHRSKLARQASDHLPVVADLGLATA